MKNNKILIFVVSILSAEMAGVIGSIFTMPSISTWYAYLKKPAISPPDWLFGIVWTSLFFLIGVSLYFIWTSNNKELKRKAVALFILQMVLNIWWSVLFFGMQSPLAALVEIVLLWLAILFNIIYFFRISLWAGILLLPYILWVSFAGILNFLLWKMNI